MLFRSDRPGGGHDHPHEVAWPGAAQAAPFGERVRVWCRAGTCGEDFAWACNLIAAACWAREVHVYQSQQHVQLVVLDVIRRSGHQDEAEQGLRPVLTVADVKPADAGSVWPEE